MAIVMIMEILGNVLHNFGLSGWRKKARLPASLEGKTVMITGANAGIGKECTRTCLRLGAKVVIACRDQKKAKAAVEEILNDVGRNKKDQCILVELDLSSLDSVRACAKQVRVFDLSLANSVCYKTKQSNVIFCFIFRLTKKYNQLTY